MSLRSQFRLCTILSFVIASGFALCQVTEAARAKHGMVVSDSALASRVGAEILQKGGNAVDAAVATGLALAVTHPAAGNIGGGGFMLVRMKDGDSVFIDYRETAPGASSAGMYLDTSGNVVPNKSLVGHLAAGVPGTVAGFYEAHKRFGKLPWKDLVEPAVKLASDGFALSYELARSLRSQSGLFRQFETSWTTYCRSGKFYEWGDNFKQPDLARTLERIAEEGRDGFYKGETAKLIADECARGKGIITQRDLEAYQPIVRAPLKGSYNGYEMVTAPPPSSGGIALIEMMNLLEPMNLRSYGFGSSGTYHRMIEAMKLAFADRSAYLGDPDFVKVPVAELTDKKYASVLRGRIKPDVTTSAKDIRPGLGPIKEGENTTHYSVVDAEGNAVANTYTLNTSYGSGVTVKGAGFLLNNEMDDFAAKPGVPNGYGLIQGEANAIAPGKRPLSSMTPTVLLKNGQLVMVLGSPGGPTIINTVMQTILNLVDFDMTVQQAVSSPRIHHQWLPDEVRYEAMALNPDVRALLEKMGHQFAVRPASIGSCHAIFVEPSTGNRLAGVDQRIGTSGAAGY